MIASPPQNERQRLEQLRALDILDTPPEKAFDDVVEVASLVFGTPTALVSLVDEKRQYFKARVGFAPSETSRDVSFCAHAILGNGVFMVEDARLDPRFCDNPLVTSDPRVRFYAGAPLTTPSGHNLGTLCVLDTEPRCLTESQQKILQALARRVVSELELRRANALLRSTKERLGRLFNALGEGVLAIDEAHHVSFIDSTAAKLFGVAEQGSADRPWREVLDLGPDATDVIEDVLRGERPLPASLPIPRTGRLVEIRVADVPDDPTATLLALTDITELGRMRTLLGRADATYGIVGGSPPIRAVVERIERVAAVDIPVILGGETGTGKEIAARAIHAASRRRRGPFVAINCASLTESLLSSQLFGHSRGSFTGAVRDQPGLFEAAGGGTLFLDEIGDMPLALQTSLLRVLDSGEVVRLGESRPRRVDVRIVSASNRELPSLVKAGGFREDLYYRLKGLFIRLPALRERREDIPLLAHHFAALNGAEATEFSDAAMAALMEHDWPGNVRELRSAVSYAVLHCARGVVHTRDLPAEVTARTQPPPLRAQPPADPRTRLLQALDEAHGNRAEAARLLGISRATLYRRLQEYGIGAA